MKKISNKICISIKLCPTLIKNTDTFFLNFEFKEFGSCLIVAAILINSKKLVPYCLIFLQLFEWPFWQA